MPYANREKQKEYQRRWMAIRRAEYLNDKTCAQCGQDYDLEIDHINPELKITHAFWSWSEKRRFDELSKCQVLCSSCHQSKTDTMYSHVRQHGRIGMYHRGCRCSKCRGANASYRRAYRQRTGKH